MEFIYGVYDNKWEDYFGYFKTEQKAIQELITQSNRLKDENYSESDFDLVIHKNKSTLNGVTLVVIHPIVLR